jgi:short-subunit dehydrogenase
MARSFDGTSVLISGAGGGLGRSLALGFGAVGARVVAFDRDADGVAQTAAAMRAKGWPCCPIAGDVTRPEDWALAVAEARRAYGGVDVVVHNAGITHRSAFARTDPAVIRRVMEVNFFGAVHGTHAALPELVARRGMLIAISSVAGFAPLVARTGYAASKHALHGFFGSLRSEVEPLGVKVLLVCPSFIRTGIEKAALAGDGAPARHPQSVVGTRASPNDVAAQIVAAAQAERRLLLPGAVARQAWWVVRLAPRVYERLMIRRLKSELREEGGG